MDQSAKVRTETIGGISSKSLTECTYDSAAVVIFVLQTLVIHQMLPFVAVVHTKAD